MLRRLRPSQQPDPAPGSRPDRLWMALRRLLGVRLYMAVVAVDRIPGGRLLATGGGVGIGMCMALAAIVALAWLLLWVVVGSAGPRCRVPWPRTTAMALS